MKILFAGTPHNAANTLTQLVNLGFDVAAVLTREDAFVGRSQAKTASEVALAAQQLGIEVIKANKVTDEVVSRLQSLGIDIGIVVAYGSFLNRKTLDALPLGWFNLHYSLLPKYRGAAPVQWAIHNLDSETGVSFFKIDEGMDTGPLVGQVAVTIEPGENSADLLGRLTNIGISLVAESLPAIFSGIARFETQNEDGVSFAPKINRADAQVDWLSNAKEIDAKVRAMNPEPISWCLFRNEPIRILITRPSEIEFAVPPGKVMMRNKEVFVQCGQGSLQLLQLQPAGKKPMDAMSWINGQQTKEIQLA